MSESINSLYSHLDHLGLIQISGPDCLKFLNGQITLDLNEVSEAKFSPGAVCTPKGRVIANFIISREYNDFLIITLKSRTQDLITHLKKYSVFFKVEINDLSDSKIVVSSDAGTEGSRQYVGDSNRHIRVTNIMEPTQQEPEIKGATSWQFQDIMDGIPWVDSESIEVFIPQHLNLQWIDGISFKKGCYTGQEIVTRMHYKGNLKRYLHLCRSKTPLIPGQKLLNSTNKVVGQVLNTSDNQSLIVIEVTAINSPLFSNNEEELNLEFSKLPYSDRIEA